MEEDRRREGATTTRNASGHHAIFPRNFQHSERANFFSNRVVREYKALPDYVKKATNINSFKNSLDSHRGTPSRNNSRPTRERMSRGLENQGTS